MQDKKPALWLTILAFAIIYIVWGSTFLAIRIGVSEVPPLLFAALRFLTAGVLLFGFTLLKGDRPPTRAEWSSIALLAVLIFVIDYGCLFWAEQRVPSGLASVLLSSIPLFTALGEIILLRTQKLTPRLAIALLAGIAGVGVLMSRGFNLGGTPIDTYGAIAIIIGAIAWSLGSVLSRKLALPESKPLSSGAQMFAGGLMLTAASASFGEFHNFHITTMSKAAWIALVYLIIFGSIIGFTAYVWLIHHHSPTTVGTYAYVNPAIAVLLGYFFAKEPLGPRTILGTAFILASVILITTINKSVQPPPLTEQPT